MISYHKPNSYGALAGCGVGALGVFLLSGLGLIGVVAASRGACGTADKKFNAT